MTALPELAGILQRGMFIVAYFWYAGAARGVMVQAVPG